ncbi:unnamed protein product [Microthlaspi erraticum]|uniref:Uncharacterized protein n=1 Tax=Microthlaspi erraticum TaxID=1685480 RepID=A0A6D2IFS1_9BRAS|nr:unnamed protein product [Microthlaspi erraticum]
MGHEEHGGTWHMEAAQLDTQRKKGEAILKTSSTVYSTNRSSSSTRPAKLQLDRAGSQKELIDCDCTISSLFTPVCIPPHILSSSFISYHTHAKTFIITRALDELVPPSRVIVRTDESTSFSLVGSLDCSEVIKALALENGLVLPLYLILYSIFPFSNLEGNKVIVN